VTLLTLTQPSVCPFHTKFLSVSYGGCLALGFSLKHIEKIINQPDFWGWEWGGGDLKVIAEVSLVLWDICN